MSPEAGALATLVVVALWLRVELRRVRLSGMLHVEPVNQASEVARLQNELADTKAQLEKAKDVMDQLRDELLSRRGDHA